MHDRIAELRGLRDELDNCENGPRKESRSESADQVREQIERVRGEIAEDADRLDTEANDLMDKGQDGRAGEAAVAARYLRRTLDADGTDELDQVPAIEARARALAAANEARNRADSQRLHQALGTAEDEEKAAPKPGRRRNAAAAKAPGQT